MAAKSKKKPAPLEEVVRAKEVLDSARLAYGEAVLVCYEQGQSVPSIAEALKVSRGRVYQIMVQARKDRGPTLAVA